MKLKEAQLLGILAVIAIGIIVLCLWGGGHKGDEVASVHPAPAAQSPASDRSDEILRQFVERQQSQVAAKGAAPSGVPGIIEISPAVDARAAHENRLSGELDSRAPGQIDMRPAEVVNPPVVQPVAVVQSGPRTHVVKKGETLSSISAKYYNTANKWKLILDANKNTLKDPRALRPNMKLLIPADAPAATASRAAAQSELAASAGLDVVADAGGAAGSTAVASLPLNPATVETPPATPSVASAPSARTALLSAEAPAPAPSPKYYVVQRGDTLWGIAVKFYKDRGAAQKILDANKGKIGDPRALMPGTRLILP